MSLLDLDNGEKTSFFGMTTYKVNKHEMWGWMHKGFHFKWMLGELTMHLICNFDRENPCNISLNIDYASLQL
jgi:hypothetical protein